MSQERTEGLREVSRWAILGFYIHFGEKELNIQVDFRGITGLWWRGSVRRSRKSIPLL